VKQQLSRGFVVGAKIQWSSSTLNGSNANLDIQYPSCDTAEPSDTYVTIIGYGTKNSTPVWIVETYGSEIVDQRPQHFFFAIGKNVMCLERTLIAMKSKGYGSEVKTLAEQVPKKIAANYALRGTTGYLDSDSVCPYFLDRKCTTSCPNGYWAQNDGYTCEKCPLTYNRTCVQYCPMGTTNQDGVCTKCEVKYEGKCMETCPTWTILDEETKLCTNCSLTYNDGCVDSCPADTVERKHMCVYCKIEYMGFCFSSCPAGTQQVGNTCTKCALTYNNECVAACPSKTKAKNGVCLPCRETSLGVCVLCDLTYNN